MKTCVKNPLVWKNNIPALAAATIPTRMQALCKLADFISLQTPYRRRSLLWIMTSADNSCMISNPIWTRLSQDVRKRCSRPYRLPWEGRTQDVRFRSTANPLWTGPTQDVRNKRPDPPHSLDFTGQITRASQLYMNCSNGCGYACIAMVESYSLNRGRNEKMTEKQLKEIFSDTRVDTGEDGVLDQYCEKYGFEWIPPTDEIYSSEKELAALLNKFGPSMVLYYPDHESDYGHWEVICGLTSDPELLQERFCHNNHADSSRYNPCRDDLAVVVINPNQYYSYGEFECYCYGAYLERYMDSNTWFLVKSIN